MFGGFFVMPNFGRGADGIPAVDDLVIDLVLVEAPLLLGRSLLCVCACVCVCVCVCVQAW